MSMSEPLCVFCKHFVFIEGDYGYSEYTPGYDATFRCNKSLLDIDLCDMTTEDFREKILTAKKCPKYYCVVWDRI